MIKKEKDDMTMNKKLTIERIKEIIKEEFGVKLYEKGWGIHISKSRLISVDVSYSQFYVTLKSVRENYSLEMNIHRITTEKDLLDLIKKFKKVRRVR